LNQSSEGRVSKEHFAWSLISMSEVVDPRLIARSLVDHWSPRIVGEIDDSFLKVAKVKGEFPWHSHEDEDEMFMVLDGKLSIHMEDRTVELTVGEVFVVPKGVRHHPVAKDECLILLIERKSTKHMGGVVMERTRTIEQQWNQQ
jgi:mannose-6-phosphate isomerase-like protein (cupin superfamily)